MITGNDFIESYIKWFREGVSFSDKNGYTEITTPFVDSHNDMIQIYVQQDGNSLLLSDDGWTIGDLRASGVDLRNSKRRLILNRIVNRFGIGVDGDELVVKAGMSTFPQKKHSLIQAMLSVSDLMAMSGSRVPGVFSDNVFSYLQSKRIWGSRDIQLQGKSGLSHKFDILIPKTNDSPETIIQAVNNPNKNAVQLTLFEWTDIHVQRDDDSRLFVFLNDSRSDISASVINAFEEYEIDTFPWKDRDRIVEKFSA